MEKQILKIYGPYKDKKDKRQRVIIRYTDLSTKVTSYARFLYQQKNGEIDPKLTVDHIDENPENDDINNLQVLTRKENIAKARASGKQATEWFEGICLECNRMFTKPMRQIRANQQIKGRPGPFCSKSCAGTFNQRKQKEFRKPKPLSFVTSVIEIKST